MTNFNKFIIDNSDADIRLDSYLSNLLENVSRTKIQNAIKSNLVFVNDKTCKPSHLIKTDDIVTIEDSAFNEIDIQPENIPIEVVYNSDNFAIVNKPSGMLTHPTSTQKTGTLVNALLYKFKNNLSNLNGNFRKGIVHRLDKDTSGLLIIAKNDLAHMNMSKQIQDRKVIKKYIALVRGTVPENEATIDMPIARSQKDRKKMAVDKNGKEAVTHFKVLARYDKYTLLEVKIDTGRTHQIRVHMSYIGHPVIGDEVYSNGKNEFGVKGQMLHAKYLEFKHPITGKDIKLEAPLPEYFEEVLKQLEERKLG